LARRRTDAFDPPQSHFWTKFSILLSALASAVALIIFVTGFSSIPAMFGAVRPTERDGVTLGQLWARLTPYSTSLDFVADGTVVYELERPLILGEGDHFTADRVLVDPYHHARPTDAANAMVFALQCRPDRRCRSMQLGDSYVYGGRSAFAGDILLLGGVSSLEFSLPREGVRDSVSVNLTLFDIHARRRALGGFGLVDCDPDRVYTEGRVDRLRVNEDKTFSLTIRTTCGRIIGESTSIALERQENARLEFLISGAFNEHDELINFRAERTPTDAVRFN
jgi:hypothetical protein